MPKIKLLEGIIEYERVFVENPYNGVDTLTVKWCGVKFLQDFGCWKAGDAVHDLVFDPLMGYLIAYDHFGDDHGFCEVDLKVKVKNAVP